MNAFTVCLCNHCSGKYITRQHSEEVSLCPRCVARSKFRGYASQQVTRYLYQLHKWLVPWPRMTLVHDSHHGYTDQLWPTLQCPKELQCNVTAASFYRLGGESFVLLWVGPLIAPSVVQAGSDLRLAPLRRPASVAHGDVAEKGHSGPEGSGMLSSSTLLLWEPVWESMPICILLYFFHLSSSSAIRLLLHCLRNYRFYWLCITSSNNRIYI